MLLAVSSYGWIDREVERDAAEGQNNFFSVLVVPSV